MHPGLVDFINKSIDSFNYMANVVGDSRAPSRNKGRWNGYETGNRRGI
jgi:hypothetical protein